MQTVEPSFLQDLRVNLRQSPQLIQVVLGPRQVGKTTGVLQMRDERPTVVDYASADDELAPSSLWIEEKWQNARLKRPDGILILDEIQKVPNWSAAVKKMWDRQKREKTSSMKLVLLGSSSLQIQTGLQESLTGRFQLLRATHWDFAKSRQLAGLSLEEFILYGGYPGSYALLKKRSTWEKYIRDSIVDTVIGKDILNLARVAKPALFRQAFGILMSYPAQEISYTKLLGQLQDSGNTDLIKYYLELYEGAFLVKSLQKYSGRPVVKRSSSPKLVPLCGALINRDALGKSEGIGRAFEATVGACLVNHDFDVYYWRDGSLEVDYIVVHEGHLYAIEVKSGRKKSPKGLDAFIKAHKNAVPVFISPENIETFLTNPSKVLAQ